MHTMKHVGLDVHAKTIAIAVATAAGVQDLCKIPHDVGKLKKTLARVGALDELRVVYEAGPTGYGLARTLLEWGVSCGVIAPSLMPQAPGQRVKTDRLDARRLAQLSFGGLLTEVRIPDPEQEAFRDLVRAREAAKEDQTRVRHQLSKLLLRRGVKAPSKVAKWGSKYMLWVRTLRLSESAAQFTLEELINEVEHQGARLKRLEARISEAVREIPEEMQAMVAALQGFKGIQMLTAATIVSEIGDMARFGHPIQLMSYAGVVPSEYSSGDETRRGAITKSGNAHLRRVVGEAAWSYARGVSTPGPSILKRREGLSAAVVQIHERADHRLRSRFTTLLSKGKHRNKVVTAVSRELLGFIWAAGVEAQKGARAQLR